jgi:sugar phosphate isomerase/epimerase
MRSPSTDHSPLRLGVSAFIAGHWLTPDEVAVLDRSPAVSLEMAAPWFWDVPPAEVHVTVEALRGSTLELWSVHAPFGKDLDLSSLDDEVQQATLQAIKEAFWFAAELGCELVVVHPSAEPIPPEERPARLARSRDGLAELAGATSASGPRMAIEPLPRSCLGNSLAEMELLLEGLPEDRAGICLDVNHANVGQDLETFIARSSSRIWTLHISDNDGVDEKHWLPGEGVIDWRALLHALDRVGYDGPFLYEVSRGDKGLAERLADFGENYARLMVEMR